MLVTFWWCEPSDDPSSGTSHPPLAGRSQVRAQGPFDERSVNATFRTLWPCRRGAWIKVPYLVAASLVRLFYHWPCARLRLGPVKSAKTRTDCLRQLWRRADVGLRVNDGEPGSQPSKLSAALHSALWLQLTSRYLALLAYTNMPRETTVSWCHIAPTKHTSLVRAVTHISHGYSEQNGPSKSTEARAHLWKPGKLNAESQTSTLSLDLRASASEARNTPPGRPQHIFHGYPSIQDQLVGMMPPKSPHRHPGCRSAKQSSATLPPVALRAPSNRSMQPQCGTLHPGSKHCWKEISRQLPYSYSVGNSQRSPHSKQHTISYDHLSTKYSLDMLPSATRRSGPIAMEHQTKSQ